MEVTFHPDWDEECHQCGASPCVIVEGHPQPNTKLCGPCFFHDRLAVDPDIWEDKGDSE